MEKVFSLGGRIPSPLPFMTTPSLFMPIPSLPLFNSKPSPLHLNHDIILLYFQHLSKYPKNEKDTSIATSSIDVATQEPTLGSPIVAPQEPTIKGLVVATQEPTIRVEEDIVVCSTRTNNKKQADMDKPKKLLEKKNMLSYNREEII
jgi:hypothetical protein